MKCLVVCGALGQLSEPWLWRQVAGLKRLQPEVVCWRRENPALFPTDTIPVHMLDLPMRPMDGPARWLFRLRNLPGGNFYGSVGSERAVLTKLVGASCPAVIFCHYGQFALRVLPVAKRLQIPLVAHFNGLDVSASLNTDRWYRWSLEKALPTCAAVVVVAGHQERWMLEHGVARDRLHVIPYGVPVEACGLSASVARASCKFLAVGRFVAKKSPFATLRAFHVCSRVHADVSLTMIGDGPLKDEAINLARELGVLGKVSFLPGQSNARVLEEMQRASVFVQHSVTAANGDMEGWPVAIGEAAACGLPIVATRHGGIVQQVEHGETGYLVEEHDWEEMGRIMALLARNPEVRRRMGLAARQRAVRMFDIRRQIDKLERVLEAAGSGVDQRIAS